VLTRKAWRNRGPSAGEGVLALLEALRDGLGAEGVGLFDDDRADPSQQLNPVNFWHAFEDGPCATIDWAGWYRELRRNERVETICGCGEAHHLCGFLIHGRWALLLVAPPALQSAGAAAIASSVRALAAMLPPAKDREKTAGGGLDDGERESTAEGVPWWVRREPQ
jgi:hypothetical protein